MNRDEAIRTLQNSMWSEEKGGEALWDVILACQEEIFYTSSGLPFRYTVKRTRSGAYGGELEVSRKEGSKTLTRSSIMLAFRRVREDGFGQDGAEASSRIFVPPFYKGPKAIGQIFGISYIYSLFWKIGLIRVPGKVEEKMLEAYKVQESARSREVKS